MESAGDVQELAPRASPRLWSGFAGMGAIAIVVGALSMRGNSAAIGLGILFILAGVALPAAYWLWLANARMLIGRGVVGYQNMLGQQRFLSTSDIARAVWVTIVYQSPRHRDQLKPALLLVGADGRCLLKVRVQQWRDDDTNTFIAATGCVPQDLGFYKTGQVAREFPGSVGFMYAHTGWTALITAGIVLALGGLFEWWILSSR